MAKIAVVGSLNMDLVAVTPRIPVAGETIIGKNFFTVPGGKGANQAYAAAKLGGETAMIGRVGSDDFGQTMRKNLADVGCNVTGVRNVDGPSGVALIFVAESGANSIVVAPGANHKLEPRDIAAESPLFDACLVTLLQLETPLETVTAAAQYAKKRGARVILDPGPHRQRACPLTCCVQSISSHPTKPKPRFLLVLSRVRSLQTKPPKLPALCRPKERQ